MDAGPAHAGSVSLREGPADVLWKGLGARIFCPRAGRPLPPLPSPQRQVGNRRGTLALDIGIRISYHCCVSRSISIDNFFQSFKEVKKKPQSTVNLQNFRQQPAFGPRCPCLAIPPPKVLEGAKTGALGLLMWLRDDQRPHPGCGEGSQDESVWESRPDAVSSVQQVFQPRARGLLKAQLSQGQPRRVTSGSAGWVGDGTLEGQCVSWTLSVPGGPWR